MSILDVSSVFVYVSFVFLGAVFAQKKISLPRWIAVCGLVLSFGLLLAEAYLLKNFALQRDYNFYLSLVPAVFFLFCIAKDMQLKDRKCYGKLRRIGTLTYYLHLFVLRFATLGIGAVQKFTGVNLSAFALITVVIATLLLSALIEHLSHKEKLRWLRHLYA